MRKQPQNSWSRGEKGVWARGKASSKQPADKTSSSKRKSNVHQSQSRPTADRLPSGEWLRKKWTFFWVKTVAFITGQSPETNLRFPAQENDADTFLLYCARRYGFSILIHLILAREIFNFITSPSWSRIDHRSAVLRRL